VVNETKININEILTHTSHHIGTHSHAEATLASRVDAHVTDNIGIVKALVDDERVRGGGTAEGEGRRLGENNGSLLLVGNSGLEEAGGGAHDGEEKNWKEGASHGDGISMDREGLME
jgi:hypothetical protein